MNTKIILDSYIKNKILIIRGKKVMLDKDIELRDEKIDVKLSHFVIAPKRLFRELLSHYDHSFKIIFEASKYFVVEDNKPKQKIGFN